MKNNQIFPLKTGDFVKCKDQSLENWYAVAYPYDETGEEIFAACGLGKRGSFPVLSSTIIKKEQFFSFLCQFHKGDVLFWSSTEGRLFVSYPQFNWIDDIVYATGDSSTANFLKQVHISNHLHSAISQADPDTEFTVMGNRNTMVAILRKTLDNRLYSINNIYHKHEIVRGLHGRLTYGQDEDCAFIYQFMPHLILIERNSIIKVPTEGEKLGNFFSSIREYVKDDLLPFLDKLSLDDHEKIEIKGEINEAEAENDVEDSCFIHKDLRII